MSAWGFACAQVANDREVSVELVGIFWGVSLGSVFKSTCQYYWLCPPKSPCVLSGSSQYCGEWLQGTHAPISFSLPLCIFVHLYFEKMMGLVALNVPRKVACALNLYIGPTEPLVAPERTRPIYLAYHVSSPCFIREAILRLVWALVVFPYMRFSS